MSVDVEYGDPTHVCYVDNGSALWPPQGFYGNHADDWPFIFEVWEKYQFPEDRRKILAFRNRLRCRQCRVVGVGIGWAREHGLTDHPGKGTSFNYENHRWVWEMLGFADLYDGKPTGWYMVGDGRSIHDRAYEADCLELGWVAANAFWISGP